MKLTRNMIMGRRGERAAEEFLVARGFETLARNYRFGRAEIDLIVRRYDLIVFVEVKTRASAAFGYPEEWVDARQTERILEAAEQYLLDAGWSGRVRYDILAVQWRGAAPQIEHFEDAFY